MMIVFICLFNDRYWVKFKFFVGDFRMGCVMKWVRVYFRIYGRV